MISIRFLKPFYTKVSGNKLRLVFAYQYLSITKEDEDWHFIPIEGKEIILDLKRKMIENKADVFVFQRGNRFLRLTLEELSLLSNINRFLIDIAINVEMNAKSESEDVEEVSSDFISEETYIFIQELEKKNIMRCIDKALEEGNVEVFNELSDKLNDLNILEKS